ncbi:hypothetical protein M409DRAFT_61437 [Zasmidium cellare ATCC 36951]|uniref:Uncharacterized protein n=1 Tax=Zasmidium cellare ATCC 36951 TaxID=1080233 RepID=A0A6A6BVD0_ZASCE|nr:uncharacterized protein M409DRAFT_61437 [Zasmidium cellare ATCC 36951]KAF2158721.1 hypothetical protein M409DRAFT_61437 [Zasmidium cellare ATCC 36951]
MASFRRVANLTMDQATRVGPTDQSSPMAAEGSRCWLRDMWDRRNRTSPRSSRSLSQVVRAYSFPGIDAKVGAARIRAQRGGSTKSRCATLSRGGAGLRHLATRGAHT